jgi:hypothetical protein
MKYLIFTVAAVVFTSSAGIASPGLHPTAAPTLDTGYGQMYNLQFAEAHNTFRAWKAAHPDDPVGPVSDAAAYLFAEFDRMHILQAEFFTDDVEFKTRVRPAPDAALKQAFFNQLDECERIVKGVLARNPQDTNAQFAKILALGLRSNYLALIEKRYVPALSYMKAGRTAAQALLAKDGSLYDCYVAVGVENYTLGVKSAPVRWMLSVTGSKVDKAEGIRELKLTAEKGHYLEPFARLLLAVAALRDKDKNKARELLAGLSKEFPKNGLYARELARLQ